MLACLRVQADNAALAAYEYQQQLEEHAAALQEELDGCKAQHSQQQARMQKVTDELLRQVWGKVCSGQAGRDARCWLLSVLLNLRSLWFCCLALFPVDH